MRKRLRNQIRKLRIKRGDIVLAHPSLQDQFKYLTVPEIDWKVPILWTTNVCNVRSIPKEKLREMLKKEDVNEKVQKKAGGN